MQVQSGLGYKPEPKHVTGQHHHPYDFTWSLKEFMGTNATDSNTGLILISASDPFSYEDDFLDRLDEQTAGVWNCLCCKRFFETAAHLIAVKTVITTTDGAVSFETTMRPALWDLSDPDLPVKLRPAYKHLNAKVTALIDSIESDKNVSIRPFVEVNDPMERVGLLGTTERGGYQHLHLDLRQLPGSVYDFDGNDLVFSAAENSKVFARAFGLMKQALGDEVLPRLEQVRYFITEDSRFKSIIGNKLDYLPYYDALLRLFMSSQTMFKLACLSTPKYAISYTRKWQNSLSEEFVEEMLRSDPARYDALIKRYANSLDPLNYQRAERAAVESDYKRLVAMIEEKGYANCFNWRLANLDGFPFANRFQLTETASPKKSSDLDVLKGLAVGDKDKENPPLDLASLPKKRMALGKFVNEVLPTLDRLTIENVRYLSSTVIYFADLDLEQGDPIPVKERIKGSKTLTAYCHSAPSRVIVYIPENASIEVIGTVVDTARGQERTALIFQGVVPKELAGNLPKPLFAENYNSDFYHHRRSLESLISEEQFRLPLTEGSEAYWGFMLSEKLSTTVPIVGHIGDRKVIYELIEVD